MATQTFQEYGRCIFEGKRAKTKQDNDNQEGSSPCQHASHFMPTCIFFWTCMFGKKCMLTLTGKNFMSNDAVVFGEKFYPMATSLPSSVGLVSNWGVFLGESPHHWHRLLSVAPPHVPHVQSTQGATLSVPCFGLRDCAGVLSCNPVEAGGGNTWIHWTSE